MTTQAADQKSANGASPVAPSQPEQPSAALAIADDSPGAKAWALLQRKASALAASSIVPKEFQRNIPNCILAIEIADRVGLPAIMVVQNIHIINGRPGWSSAFLIASVNTSKRFTPLRFEWRGEKGDDDWACRAVSTDVETKERLEGSWIDWAMVKAEKWLDKSGSKWATMPEQMFRYRAAAFWSRTYCPEIAMGLLTEEEQRDINAITVPYEVKNESPSALEQELLATSPVIDAATGEILDETKGAKS